MGNSEAYDLQPNMGEVVYTGKVGLWATVIELPGATFVKPRFVDFDLNPGDKLMAYSASGRLIETLTGKGPKDMGTFWGLSGSGDNMSLVLEIQSEGYGNKLPFRIDQVVRGEIDPLASGGGPESICSPADFEDVICYDSDPDKWATVVASAGVMTAGNMGPSLFCSASNVSPDNYVLTNAHCLANQGECDNSEFVFKYWRTGCNNGSPPTADWVGFRCDTVVASSPFVGCGQGLAGLDFSLSSVMGDPASQFGWVEPDPIPITDGEAIYIVQHPQGRPHEIAHGSGADVDADGHVLRYYNTLDTEGGSSGSPIYRESDNKLIGLHHCGGCSTPGVGNRGMLMSDIYPLIEAFLGEPAFFSDGFESGDVSGWSTSMSP